MPDYYYPDFGRVNFDSLQSRGISNLLIDVDNTLVLRSSKIVPDENAEIIRSLLSAVPPWRVCLVSNIIAGRHRYCRVEEIARQLDVPFVAAYFFDRKPKERPFRLGMEKIGALPQNTAMIGDQLYTDVLGANRLGLVTVLIKPGGPDHWATALLGRRKRETKLLARLKFKVDGERVEDE